jgi:hypothetical protein
MPDARLSRRRFLARGLGGIAVLAVDGWDAARPAQARSRLRIDLHSRVFNGQDVPLAALLESVVAPAHPEEAALLRAGARLAQTLAWTLAPSGAEETWRLEQLARRRGPDLGESDDREIRRDRAQADERFAEALRVVLPGTDFFRRYLGSLRPDARASLGRPAAARLACMAEAGVLDRAHVDFLLGPDGPERMLLPIRPLHAFRRYTYHRYLSVRDLLEALDSGAGLLAPTVATFDGSWSGCATPTGLPDQLLAMARLVTVCGGRFHPLAPFDPRGRAPAEALTLVRDAVERDGFVGVTLCSPPDVGDPRAKEAVDALFAWCAREEVAVVGPGRPEAWARLPARHPGLRLGVRVPDGGLEDGPGLMYGLDWVRRAVEGDARDVLRRGERLLHRLDERGARESLLGDTAAAFLGLHRGRRTRERLERFYDRHGMTTPGWMRALEQAST